VPGSRAPSSAPVLFARVRGPLGTGVVAASGGRVVASALPAADPAPAVARILERFPNAREAPPSAVAGAEALSRWMAGDATPLARVPVSLEGLPPFASRVYEALRRVPPGRTVTYGELAAAAGSRGGARAVGGAMARNPLAPFVPCHRVVASGGGLGGFSGPGGTESKERFLAAEAAAPGPAIRGRPGANP
jgi:methylated-DNA-[protein]-cysteine S-methyltransferase